MNITNHGEYVRRIAEWITDRYEQWGNVAVNDFFRMELLREALYRSGAIASKEAAHVLVGEALVQARRKREAEQPNRR